MALINAKWFSYLSVLCVVAILILKCECKGGRSGGGGSHSHSSSHSSHGSSHSSYGSGHSSHGTSHSSYGSGSHSDYGSSSHSYGSGGSHHYGSDSYGHAAPGVYGSGSTSHSGSSKPIGFDHVNQQAHNSLNGGSNYHPGTAGRPGIGFDHINSQVSGHSTNQYHPYNPKTVVHPGGLVQYHPPTTLQYAPPAPVTTVQHSTTHYVPVYQPSIIHTQSSSSLDHGSSFLGGYLVGRLSSGHSHSAHVTNNYYNSDNSDGSNSNSYYTVHHYHHNRDRIPSRFSVPGEDLTACQTSVTDQLCVPNTHAFCLRNGTIMCTTPISLTSPCEQNSTERCVYSRIPCNPNLSCNVTANQTYIDFYLPCIANVTYKDNRVFDENYSVQGTYELCVTAIAHPKKLESPFPAVVDFIALFGKWHLEQLINIHNTSTTANSSVILGPV